MAARIRPRRAPAADRATVARRARHCGMHGGGGRRRERTIRKSITFSYTSIARAVLDAGRGHLGRWCTGGTRSYRGPRGAGNPHSPATVTYNNSVR